MTVCLLTYFTFKCICHFTAVFTSYPWIFNFFFFFNRKHNQSFLDHVAGENVIVVV